MPQQHPFLQALASIVPPFERAAAAADDASRLPQASSSPPEELLSLLLRKLAQGLSSMLVDRRRDASMMMREIKSRVFDHVGDKSRAELLFLAAVLLAIALFVVIIPACEAIFGLADDDGGEDHPPLSSSSSSSCLSSSSPSPSCASSCQDDDDYDEDWPPRRQEGQVVELNDLTFLHSRFDSPLVGRGGSVGSGTCHSHGSCGMETIEESSEEEEEEGEEEDDGGDRDGEMEEDAKGETSDLSYASSCPDLDATAIEEDDDDDVGCCEADVAGGTVDYYEFLDFVRS